MKVSPNKSLNIQNAMELIALPLFPKETIMILLLETGVDDHFK